MLKFSGEKIYYISSSLIYNLYQVFILIFTANIVNATAVGIISFAVAICAPVYMFFDFRMQFIILSDSHEKNNFHFYFCARLFTCVIAMAIIIIVTLLIQQPFSTKCVIILIGLFKFFESFGEIFLAHKQRQFSLKETILSKWIRTVVGFVFFSISLFLTKNIVIGSLGLFTSSLFVFIFYEMKTSKIEFNSNINQFFRAAFFMIKRYYFLGFVSLLASLSANTPRYFISYYCGMKEVGTYSILSYVAMGMVLFVTTLFQPYIPRISQYIRNSETDVLYETIKKLAIFFLLFGIIVFVFMILGGVDFFSIVFNDKIYVTRLMIAVITLGGIFNYFGLIILYILTAANLLKQQVYFYIGDISIMLISSYLLIPSHAVLGGCIAYLIVSMYHTTSGALYIYYKRNYLKKMSNLRF